MAVKRPQHDIEAIGKEYSLGQKSVRTIAREFNCSPGSISKWAKKHGWVRDKSEEVRKKTQAALITETPDGNTHGNTPTPEDVERAVLTNVHVIKAHRKSIGNSQRLVDLLSSQLKDAAGNRDELEAKIEAECEKPDGKTDYQKRNRLKKAVSLPAHAAVLRDLSTAQKNLIALERQAFNLTDKGEEPAVKHELSEGLKGVLDAAYKGKST